MNNFSKLTVALIFLFSQVAWANADGKVNINTASVETLSAMLVGIGSARAKAIVEYRNQNGKFVAVDQLLEVAGIGDGVLEMNRGKIVLADERVD